MTLLKGFSVLIVEDDPDLRELVSENFLLAGASVATASSGSEAIILVNINRYDFILSDMRMPNGDGRFLAKEVMKMEGHKPLFFLYSGYNDISDKESTELGISQIFPKPIKAVELIRSILAKFNNKFVA